MLDFSTVGIESVPKRSAFQHLAESFPKTYRSVLALAPSWSSSNRAWKNAPGGCAIHNRTPSYTVVACGILASSVCISVSAWLARMWLIILVDVYRIVFFNRQDYVKSATAVRVVASFRHLSKNYFEVLHNSRQIQPLIATHRSKHMCIIPRVQV